MTNTPHRKKLPDPPKESSPKTCKEAILSLFDEAFELSALRIVEIVQKQGFRASSIRSTLTRLVKEGNLIRVKWGLYARNDQGITKARLPEPSDGEKEDFFDGENLAVHDIRATKKKADSELYQSLKGDLYWGDNEKGHFIFREMPFGDQRKILVQIYSNGTIDVHCECRSNPLNLYDFIAFEERMTGFLDALGINYQTFLYTEFDANEDIPDKVLHGSPIKVRVFREVLLNIYQHDKALRFEYKKMGKTGVPSEQLKQWLSHEEALGIATKTKRDLQLANVVEKNNHNLAYVQTQFRHLNSILGGKINHIEASMTVFENQLISQGSHLSSIAGSFETLLNMLTPAATEEPHEPKGDFYT